MPVTTKYDKRKDAVKGLSPGQTAANKEAAKPKKTTKQLDDERAKANKGATIAASRKQDAAIAKMVNKGMKPEEAKKKMNKLASIGKGQPYKRFKKYD